MNAKNITLRPARPADAAKIAAMSRDLIETGLGWSWGPDSVARSIANKDTFTLLACDRDRVIAFAIMYFGDEHAHLNLLAVRPSHQRLGIGRHMVEWLTESAYAAGIATIHLELRAANYTARGFDTRVRLLQVARLRRVGLHPGLLPRPRNGAADDAGVAQAWHSLARLA